jgi:glycosyltransferase involved in cell wall biosynthesis
MRIGIVIYGSLDTLTGGYLYDRRLAEHFSAHGDDVEVISLPWRNYARHLCDNASNRLARRLDRGSYDVILEDELNHPSLLATNRRLKRRAGCPVVSIVHVLRSDEHQSSLLRPLYAEAERRYLAGVDGAVFCCQATRARAEALVGAPLPGVVAHPCCDHLGPPVTPGEIRRRARREGPLRVISVANVVPRKGLHVLIAALARLAPDAWRLTVAGSLTMDTGYVRRVRRLIERTGVGANVRLTGVLANDEVGVLLAGSDVIAVPSSYEGLAIAYLEGMRHGLPVIATTAGGAGEVIDHGREGWLVAPGDAESLAGHLDALGDRSRLEAMSLAARDRAARHPSWDESLAGARAYVRAISDDHRTTERTAA